MKVLLRVVLIGIAGLLLAACASAGDPAQREDEIKASLVQQTLERALLAEELPDVGLLLEQGAVVVSLENIEPAWLEGFEEVKLEALTPAEIQQRADQQGDFLFLRFDQIELQGSDRAVVSLSNSWAVSQDSTTGYLSGGGFQLEYQRQGDEWVGEISSLWIS